MKSIFRIYAKTSKGNDPFLHNQLLSMGLKPKYQELLHSYYFNANFNDIFKLSFNSFTVQNLYVQLGHRFPLTTARSSTHSQNEQLFSEYLRKINFKNYLSMQQNLIQNITLKILIRQSSSNLPSQNAMLSLLQNFLNKQVIMKQYRSMFKHDKGHKQLQNYYEIKQIVQKKWEFQQIKKQERKESIQSNLLQNKQQAKVLQKNQLQLVPQKFKQLSKRVQNNNPSQKALPYHPHLVLYIRRNHARLLLKLNTESMHKFGWKKNVGWGPIRQTLTASILYRTGLLQRCKTKKSIKLWDPFCGSGTIPLVTLSMIKSLRIHQQVQNNFVWSHWPIYNPTYLNQFIKSPHQPQNNIDVSILSSDIDINAVKNSIENFKQLISVNKQSFETQQTKNQNNFLQYKPSDQVFEVLKNSIYVACGDFEQLALKIFKNQGDKINIVTNLPYLGERSKQHHPLNQLHSIYRRFDAMVSKYSKFIDNIFVVVDSETNNKNHFVKVTKQQWILLDNFNNGGIQVCLLGWANNSLTFKLHQIISTTTPKQQALAYQKQKTQNLSQYRKSVSQIDNKNYELPKYLSRYKDLRGSRRVQQKKKARHLRAAYQIFAKKRDKNAIFEKYSRKNLALRLSQRGKSWRRKNISIVGNNLKDKQDLIKVQFESRVEQALRRSQEMKAKKKKVQNQVKRKW